MSIYNKNANTQKKEIGEHLLDSVIDYCYIKVDNRLFDKLQVIEYQAKPTVNDQG
ncbi:hypothetical protein M23134_01075 [Microscilla marina ATCC 23134]|uniref:Uncharacterized protein n=1 Tax=Microscilla marina ATCC 23134 TaxID=313606 RepID=A1ZFH7_MICM2|nr:hypothetical protein M23134_01075 [Microscilla marina ATCC 23134]